MSDPGVGAGAFLIFWFPVFGPFFSLVIVMLAVPFGLVWAPFGALICRRIARSTGLNPRRYVIAGAAYPVLFFVPWVYLVMRMRGRSVSVVLVRNIYILLYGTWLVLPIWSLYTFMAVARRAEDFGGALTMGLALISSILVFVGSLVMIAVVRKKAKYKTVDRSGRSDESVQDEVLPHIAYILPFAYLMFWLVALPLYFLLRRLFGL